MGLKRRPARQQRIASTHFLNVDLEIDGDEDLTPLVAALGPTHLLHQTKVPPFAAIVEVEEVDLDCERTISALLDLVEALDGQARALWDRCTRRRFDIGIQSGLAPQSVQFVLPDSQLRRLSAVGAEVVVTVYGTAQFGPA